MIFVIIAVIALFIVGVIIFLFPIVQVIGDSMYPTYKDGEYLHGYRLFSKIKVGDVVVCKLNRKGEKLSVIKRIAEIKGDEVFILGDNSEVSYDSREYGYVPKKNIICRVKEQRTKL